MGNSKCFQLVFTLSLAVFGVQSCFVDQSGQIERKVQQRVDDFVKKKKLECRTNLVKEAEKIVDSLLLAEAQQQLRDSLHARKPGKPEQPPAVPPIDTLDVKPIFK